MTKSLKGALLSGLVFPGAGQIALKRHARGWALVLAVTICLVMLSVRVLQQASSILYLVIPENGAIDMDALAGVANQVAQALDTPAIKLSSLCILVCWVFGIVDAYRIGRQQDLKVGRVDRTPEGQ